MPLILAIGCGGAEFLGATDAGRDAHGGAAGAGGLRDGGPDGSGFTNSGDCLTFADCGGDQCVELIPGGYRVCVAPVPEATTCSSPTGQCCKSADCTQGPGTAKCILGPIEPSCGGVVVVPTNVCATDACMSASDCMGTNPICVPAGALDRKAARCISGGCRFDHDCTAEPGGICVPVANPCCDTVLGLFCVYRDGCRSNANCATGSYCTTDATHAFCQVGVPLCPQ